MAVDVAAFTIGLYPPAAMYSAAGRTAIAALLYSDSVAHFPANLAPVLLDLSSSKRRGIRRKRKSSIFSYAQVMGVDVDRLRRQTRAEESAFSSECSLNELQDQRILDEDAISFLLLQDVLDPEESGLNLASGDVALDALFYLPMLIEHAGVVPMFDQPTLAFISWVGQRARVAGDWLQFEDFGSRLDIRQGQLAQELLGSLPAFPSATLDVVLDVRDRLRVPRVRFRAAVSEAAETLKDVPNRELHGAIAELRRRTVDPAIEDVKETLEELGAVPSLLRVSSDRITVASVAASMAVVAGGAAGTIDLGVAAQALAAIPAFGSAAAREALARREISRRVTAQPFYLLHELDRRLADGAQEASVGQSA